VRVHLHPQIKKKKKVIAPRFWSNKYPPRPNIMRPHGLSSAAIALAAQLSPARAASKD